MGMAGRVEWWGVVGMAGRVEWGGGTVGWWVESGGGGGRWVAW